jgi:hypothetical protein
LRELDGAKVAAYRDQDGQPAARGLRALYPPWLPGGLERAERSWDCPCHGSRYTYQGKVIQGPAVKNLPSKGFDPT